MTKRFLIFLVSFCLAVNLHLPAQSQSQKALNLAIAAQQLYSKGQLASAATTWQKAADVYQAEGDRLGKSKSLINKAQVLQDLGLYPKACDTLLASFEINNSSCDRQHIEQLITQIENQSRLSITQGIGLRSLGDVLRRQGNLSESQKILELSEIATRNSTEWGATLLALSNVEQAMANRDRDRWSYDKITETIYRQEIPLVLNPYTHSFSAYRQIATAQNILPITKIQAQLNYLNLLIEIENWWQMQTTRRIKTWQRQRQTRLITAATNFAQILKLELDKTIPNLIADIDRQWIDITPSHQSVYALINYTLSLTKLKQTAKVEPILQTALTQAQSIEDTLAESYVLGYLGQYYSQQQELDKATAFTNQALMASQKQSVDRDSREVTYLWQSQLGQILEQQGKISPAISAYTSAFNLLQSLRTDLNANDQIVQFDFRQEVKPVYLRLANLLLQSNSDRALKSANFIETSTDADSNLELARQVIESMQIAELDNFFQDPCSETADDTITIDKIDPQAAVIYPIILRDRLEVILSLPDGSLKKFTTIIAQEKLNQTIDLLYDSLYNPSNNNSAVNIFSTTPLDPQEVDDNMQALLPILQDLHSWLIRPLKDTLITNHVKTLVFVLNGSLQNVPISALYDGQQYLLEQYGIAIAPSLQLLNTKTMPRDRIKVLAGGLSQQVEVKGNIFPALAKVPQELNQIKEIFPESYQLLDRDFTSKKIAKQLEDNFSVIHLATHGVFSSNPDETFIITGDGQVITIEALSNLLSSSPTHPELIVLSACETATGDERAILGLAGVAVRSGTSSTIASLWSVDDSSTAQLMSQFYREFQNPSAKKVDALQKAQLSLMNSLKDNPPSPTLKNLPPHPYYWSPYVLVGNWQ